MTERSSKPIVDALGTLAHEHRLALFRMLVERGPDGLPAGVIAERLGVLSIAQLPAPGTELPAADLVPTTNLRNHRVRRQALQHNRLLLLRRPTPPRAPCDHLNPFSRSTPMRARTGARCKIFALFSNHPNVVHANQHRHASEIIPEGHRDGAYSVAQPLLVSELHNKDESLA